MPKPDLESRVAALERELARLKTAGQAPIPGKDWRRTVGMFAQDEFMQRVFAEALQLREQERKRVKRTSPKRRKP
jgi:hypothetical protein